MAQEAIGNQAYEHLFRCFLELRASNEAAHSLYRKFGFQPDGLRKGYYATACGREDAVLMSLALCEQE